MTYIDANSPEYLLGGATGYGYTPVDQGVPAAPIGEVDVYGLEMALAQYAAPPMVPAGTYVLESFPLGPQPAQPTALPGNLQWNPPPAASGVGTVTYAPPAAAAVPQVSNDWLQKLLDMLKQPATAGGISMATMGMILFMQGGKNRDLGLILMLSGAGTTAASASAFPVNLNGLPSLSNIFENLKPSQPTSFLESLANGLKAGIPILNLFPKN